MKHELIYHYTKLDTLTKLLNSIKDSINRDSLIFRATHFSKLNDPSEIKYGYQVIKEVLPKIEDESKIAEESRISGLLDAIIIGTDVDTLIMKGLEELPLQQFILSFSNNKDSLPMWAMYGSNGKGLCLGFDRNILSKTNEPLHMVDYIDVNEEGDINRVKEIVKQLYPSVIKYFNSSELLDPARKAQAIILLLLTLGIVYTLNIQHT